MCPGWTLQPSLLSLCSSRFTEMSSFSLLCSHLRKLDECRSFSFNKLCPGSVCCSCCLGYFRGSDFKPFVRSESHCSLIHALSLIRDILGRFWQPISWAPGLAGGFRWCFNSCGTAAGSVWPVGTGWRGLRVLYGRSCK